MINERIQNLEREKNTLAKMLAKVVRSATQEKPNAFLRALDAEDYTLPHVFEYKIIEAKRNAIIDLLEQNKEAYTKRE